MYIHKGIYYQARIEKDIKSIFAISRLRKEKNIKATTSYKAGKFFLLTNNYGLISALKEYHSDSDHDSLNELILESSILFDLWQNLFDNNTFNKSLLRSKCFAFSEIDDKLKEKLYKICRQMERYEPEKNIVKKIINNPTLEEEIYCQVLKDKGFSNSKDINLKSVIDNAVSKSEEKFKEEIINSANENIKIKQKEYEENIEREREKSKNEIQKLINNKRNI